MNTILANMGLFSTFLIWYLFQYIYIEIIRTIIYPYIRMKFMLCIGKNWLRWESGSIAAFGDNSYDSNRGRIHNKYSIIRTVNGKCVLCRKEIGDSIGKTIELYIDLENGKFGIRKVKDNLFFELLKIVIVLLIGIGANYAIWGNVWSGIINFVVIIIMLVRSSTWETTDDKIDQIKPLTQIEEDWREK